MDNNLNKDTAEKELLKTIENNKDVEVNLRPSRGTDMVASFKSRFLFSLDKIKANFSSHDFRFGPKIIIQALVVVTIVFLVLWIGIFIKGISRLGKLPKFQVAAVAAAIDMKNKVSLSVKDKAEYVDKLLGRNIFIPAEEKEIAAESKVKTVNTSAIDQLISNLRVVGIAWSSEDGDRFVMIEDTQAKLTYFLQEGDIIGKLKVDSIFEDKVEVSHGEETTILR